MRLKLPISHRDDGCRAAGDAGGRAGVYKIGISAGLTGYAATVDRAWRDGVEIAAATLNAKGGVMGRKLAGGGRRQSLRAAGGGDRLSQDDQLGQRQRLHQRLRLGRQFRRRRHRGARANPDGALLDPAAAARPREMGVQHPAAGRLRGREAARISQGEDADQEDRRAARSDALCRPAEGRGRAAAQRATGSRSSASSNTSRTMPISACRSAR